jgi:hypothetical protein
MEIRSKIGRLAAALAALLLMAACTIRYSESQRLAEAAPAVKEMQVIFDPTPPEKVKVVTSGNVIGLQSQHDFNVKFIAPREQRRIQELLTTGFRDRFPGIASGYGLAVSRAAATRLQLRVADEQIQNGSAMTKIVVQGQLVDAAGQTIWRFETGAKNRTVFAKFDETVVDRISVEILEALKKDRLIGG